jgi:hypothetical protein
VRCLVILGLCLFVTPWLQAQTPDPTPLDAPQPGVRPPLSPFPRFQDWSFLRDPSQRVDPYDRLKFIPLNDSKKTAACGCRHSRKAGGGRTQKFFAQMNLRSPWESRCRMLAPATTKVQTPLPPIEIHLYTAGDVIRVLAACVGESPDRVEPRCALHSTRLR